MSKIYLHDDQGLPWPCDWGRRLNDGGEACPRFAAVTLLVETGDGVITLGLCDTHMDALRGMGVIS